MAIDIKKQCQNPVDQKLQGDLCNLALRIAKEGYKENLDFSDDSIKIVEDILSDIHTNFKKTKDETGLAGIALEFGAYIVRTIQKKTGDGVWFRNSIEFGKDTFPFLWKESTTIIFPYIWCMKRITDGPADNVASKYLSCVLTDTLKKGEA